jgi:chromosome segregation protein
MRLSHITIQGFKSFAKKTTIDVTHRVTDVVGPNGSGKSNIAEAIRFVLGEQSMKSMRGKASTDVIFKGFEPLDSYM